MANYVQFLFGTQEAYDALTSKSADIFYRTPNNLYLGEKKLTNAADIADALTKIGDLTQLDTTTKVSLVAAINEVLGAVNDLADVASSGKAADVSIEDTAGNFDAEDVEAALTEIVGKIGDAADDAKITLTTAATATEGYLKTYVIKQGETEIGKIDLPKDLVVTSGTIVVLEDGDVEGVAAGTYIKLVIANQEAPIYINVADLIDVYTAAENATQVQLAISATNEISATLVNQGIENEHIKDGTIAKGKLATAVQTSLGKADTALQPNASATEIEYKPETDEGANDAVSVKAALDDIFASLGESGSVANQIKTEIEKLDATVSQAASATNSLTLQVVETDGKLTSVSGQIEWVAMADPATP